MLCYQKTSALPPVAVRSADEGGPSTQPNSPAGAIGSLGRWACLLWPGSAPEVVHHNARPDPAPQSRSQREQLRGFANRLERVAIQQPVGEGSTNQLSAAELADVQHVRSAPMVSFLGGGLPSDTLVTTVPVPVRPILAEIPLQLLDRRDTNVVEQLPSKGLDRSFQDTVQGRKSWWQPPLVHFDHTKLAFNLPRELRSSIVHDRCRCTIRFAHHRCQVRIVHVESTSQPS